MTSTNSYLSDPMAFGEAQVGQELAGTEGAVAGYTNSYNFMEYSAGNGRMRPLRQLSVSTSRARGGRVREASLAAREGRHVGLRPG